MIITVITKPVPTARERMRRRIERCLRAIAAPLLGSQPLTPEHVYRGPGAVARSLVDGLAGAGIGCVYNPQCVRRITEYVVVLSDTAAIAQAIGWKKQGKIRTLIAGPNLVTWPADCGRIIAAQEIDIFLVNSEWTRDLYLREIPELAGRCRIWPAGVDLHYWDCAGNERRRRSVLFMYKSGPWDMLFNTSEYVRARGRPVTILAYGQYTREQYRTALQESDCAVFFSNSESQGIALCESWAADVPTLAWNSGVCFFGDRGVFCPASSAPYLCADTGLFFSDIEGFRRAWDVFERERRRFAPRAWVARHMTDEVCARKLAAIFHEACGR